MANRRKVSSSSLAVSGTLTRSKSDLFIHRTRSGQARPDRKRHHHQPKDLRLKRVFSRIDDRRSESEDSEISKRSTDDSRETAPQYIDIASEFDGGKGIRVLDETNLGNLSEYNLRSTDDLRETTPPDLDVESELDGGKGVRVSEERNFGNLCENNLGLSACSRSKVIGNPSSNSYRRLLPYLKNLVEDGSSGIQILQSHGLSPKSDKNVLPNIKVVSKLDGGKSVRVSEEANLDNSSENKQGHFPWSRPKLIVNPSSVSYKRLLPYIKDLDKEGSSDIKILQSYDHSVKVEKTMNGTTTVTSDPSYEEQNNATPLGDTSMVYSGGNCGLVGNPVFGNLITNSHEEIVQNSTSKESPIHQVTSEVRFNEDSMDELNGQEQKGTNKERCRFDAENLNVPAECSEEPNSISYKRLLPCIKDLDKEGSSDIKIHHSVKVEKTMNFPLISDPSYEEQNNITPLGDSSMVYSGGNCGLVGNPVLGNLITNSHEEIVQNSTRKELPIHEVTSEVRFNEDSMDELNGQEQKGTNKERCRFDAENLNVPAECSEEVAQSTPPDVDLIRKLDGAENGSRRTLSESELNNASKRNSGLGLCSRSKLYRNPSSFSYRRLLPYLTDLAKNAPSGLEIIQSHSHTAKVDNINEESTLVLNEVTSPRQQYHTVPPADFSPVDLRENQDFKTKLVSESCVLDSQDDIHNCKATELPNVCNKNEDQVVGIMSQISPEGLDSEFETLCKSLSCTPTISEDLSFEELAGGMMRETDRSHTKKVSRFENFSHGVNRALAPRKSILKKQSRGCIGICMCLDCVSFRVHAERAYEFSRRQMLGADEVVERLVKELSCLRNVMERSQVPVVDGDGERTLVNQEQVKKVCKRALCVEEQAKLRMKQLFCDLRTHCKVPGPRVSFSEAVDERVIP